MENKPQRLGPPAGAQGGGLWRQAGGQVLGAETREVSCRQTALKLERIDQNEQDIEIN